MTCAIAVMAKAPRPGAVKTRLIPPLTPESAMRASAAFLRDVTENVRAASRRVAIEGYVAYAPAGLESAFEGRLAEGTSLVLADGSIALPAGVEGFGRCLLHAAVSLFAMGHTAVCVLNSDSPNLPTALLEEAARVLAEPGDRAVLGAAEDGGYYVLGMKRPHAHLFTEVAWSTDRVAEETRRRAAEIGLDVHELAPWYDVDDGASLRRLWRSLQPSAPAGDPTLRPSACPATAALLRELALFDEG